MGVFGRVVVCFMVVILGLSFMPLFMVDRVEANPDIIILRPSAVGHADWLFKFPDVDENYDKVDEVISDGDTTYVWHEKSNPSPDRFDAYNITDLPGGADTVASVKVYALVRYETGSGWAMTVLRTGGVTYYGSSNPLTAGYVSIDDTWDDNPQTGLEWTVSDINALQIGVRLGGGVDGDRRRCTQVYVEVDYTSGPVIPTVTTQAVDDILYYTATGNGTITDTGGENATKRGIVWNITGSPDVGDDKSEETGSFGTGAFDRPMTGLLEDTHYYVKAYAYNSAGYGYGNEVEFDTLALVVPAVTTQAVDDISYYTATGNGTITDTGGENATKRGIVWNTTGSPDVGDDKSEETGSFGTGAFDRPMTGLLEDTHYYVRAYAYNSVGYGYGNEVEFDTLAIVVPAVTTQAVDDIGSTTATGHGTITDIGGENATKRGVCWNTTGNPDVGDDKSEEVGSFGTGVFERLMAGLTPEEHYYVKAYAYNSAGYGYGNEVEFDTTAVGEVGVPTSFVAVAVSDYLVGLSWVKGEDADDTLIIRKVGSQPESKTDGEQVYLGSGAEVEDRVFMEIGLELDKYEYFYSAWGKTGEVYSEGSAELSIGGFMLDVATMYLPWVIALGLMAVSAFRKSVLIYFGVFACMFAVIVNPPEGQVWIVVAAAVIMAWSIVAVIRGYMVFSE